MCGIPLVQRRFAHQYKGVYATIGYIIARERLKPIINSLGDWLDARRAGRVASTLRNILNHNSTSAEDIECAIQIIKFRKSFQKEYLAYVRAEGLESVVKDIEGISRFIYSGDMLARLDQYGRLITGFIDRYGNFEYWGFEELERNIRESESLGYREIIAEIWQLDLDAETEGKQSDQ